MDFISFSLQSRGCTWGGPQIHSNIPSTGRQMLYGKLQRGGKREKRDEIGLWKKHWWSSSSSSEFHSQSGMHFNTAQPPSHYRPNIWWLSCFPAARRNLAKYLKNTVCPRPHLFLFSACCQGPLLKCNTSGNQTQTLRSLSCLLCPFSKAIMWKLGIVCSKVVWPRDVENGQCIIRKWSLIRSPLNQTKNSSDIKGTAWDLPLLSSPYISLFKDAG